MHANKPYRRIAWAGAAACVGMLVLMLFPLLASSRTPRRDIVLVARGMAFYLADGSGPNPMLTLKPDEKVRLVLRNQDPGVTHDFTVPAWNLATQQLHGAGEASIVVRAPSTRGMQEYRCNPHATMMRGHIAVE
jgi:hypothetical protein